MKTKRCTKCKEIKPISEFNKKGNGRQSKCRVCTAEYVYERRCRLRGGPPVYRFAQKGENHPAWKGGRARPRIWMPEHPRANSNGYVLEHIVVAERKLGRPVLLGEEVHHIDGNPKNNNPENLKVCPDRATHMAFHKVNGWSRKWGHCRECGRTDRPHKARGLCKACYKRYLRKQKRKASK